MAQTRPQLTWQGYVAGGAVLYIQGDRVDMEGRGTGAVEKPTIRLFEPLPAAPRPVQFEVRRGRGSVKVVEQPSPANEFTAVVRIDPEGVQHELFVIDFFWGMREMTWSGTVDDEAVIEIRGRLVSVRTVRGQEVTAGQTSFASPLPREAVNVWLERLQGRGRVELIEQPGPANDYAARIRILDDQAGADRYAFRLRWNGPDTSAR